MPKPMLKPISIPAATIFAALACALAGPKAHAATIRVPADQPTIQAGIDAASAKDTVLVAPGTYTGPGNTNLDFRGTDLVLRSAAGPAATTIDGGGVSRGFRFHGGETDAAVVEGFTLERCYVDPPAAGAGMLIEGASPTIARCVFSNGQVPGTASGGIDLQAGAAPTISDCSFLGNRAEGAGGVGIRNSSPTIVRCLFQGNIAIDFGGGISCSNSAPAIVDCVFIDNQAAFGAGIYLYGSSPTISGCSFIGNDGVAIRAAYSSSPIMSHCTFYGNGSGVSTYLLSHASVDRTIIAFSLSRAVSCELDGAADLTCCDVFGNTGGDWVGCIASQSGMNGNFSADPRFCAAPGDLHLDESSPCAPAHAPAGCGLIGAWPVGCGATAVGAATWGAIKAAFAR